MRLLYAFLWTALPVFASAQIQLKLSEYASGFTNPLGIVHAGDSRLFVVERAAQIWILDSTGKKLPQPFLKIDDRVLSGNERGLLGLAFDPAYAQNGRFYVYYTRKPDGDLRISRFSVSANNPNKADSTSEVILLEIDHPATNHNGGQIEFGPDGYLYAAPGDGGGAGDPSNNAQNTSLLLGKMLRIDVSGTGYTVPPSNPFVGNAAYRPEIWSVGLRNAWRFSFDRETGNMWIADVGQSEREEINFEPKGTGGRNYGWRCYEGTVPYNTTGCPPMSSFTLPVFEYDNNSLGCSVTGGYVYRGQAYSGMYGHYIFTDFCSGRWWATNATDFQTVLLADLSNFDYVSLGEDKAGELYMAGINSGKIYRVADCASLALLGVTNGPVCDNQPSGAVDLSVNGGLQPVVFNWSNGSKTEDLAGLLPGTFSVTVTDAAGCTVTSSFIIENLAPVKPDITPLAGGTFACSGDTVILQASEAPNGFIYQWYQGGSPIPGAESRQISITETGSYSVQFLNLQCASETSAAYTVLFTNPGNPQPFVQSGSLVICPGDTTVLSVNSAPQGFSYQWYQSGSPLPGAENAKLAVTETGAYSVQFISPDCQSRVSMPLQVDAEALTPPDITRSGNTLSVPAIWATYKWFLNGVPISGATGPTLVFNQNGLYSVHVTSAKGCVYTDNAFFQVSSVQMPANWLKLTLQPNPAAQFVRLDLDLQHADKIMLHLTDLNGHSLEKRTVNTATVRETFDLSGLPAGIYLLSIGGREGVHIETLVKQ